jgi:hypothetical protein
VPGRSEPEILLGRAAFHVRVGLVDNLAGAVARSHLSDGRAVAWVGPVPDGARLAVDAELASATPPTALQSRYGGDDFWRRWTRTECLAKLAGVPVLTWLGRHGLDAVPSAGVVVRSLLLCGEIQVGVACEQVGQRGGISSTTY